MFSHFNPNRENLVFIHVLVNNAKRFNIDFRHRLFVFVSIILLNSPTVDLRVSPPLYYTLFTYLKFIYNKKQVYLTKIHIQIIQNAFFFQQAKKIYNVKATCIIVIQSRKRASKNVYTGT